MDAEAVCEGIAGDLGSDSLVGRIPDAILAIGDELDDKDAAELIDINDDLGRVLEVAPPEYATVIRSLKEPFQQVQDVVSGGGGQLSMDTSRVQADVTELMELCVADGYTIS
ncbi:hypothetical protein AB1046_23040 [Promicromonospora sp. Populi]|uniref:hypothetical protein n=1 Tax=Promicromonospora sp. Populi TaxID=3239420 RepID=UPI0034E2AD8C